MNKENRKSLITVLGRMMPFVNDENLIKDFKKASRTLKAADINQFIDHYFERYDADRKRIYVKSNKEVLEMDNKIVTAYKILKDERFNRTVNEINSEIHSQASKLSKPEFIKYLKETSDKHSKTLQQCYFAVSTLKEMPGFRDEANLKKKNIEYLYKEISDLYSISMNGEFPGIKQAKKKEEVLINNFLTIYNEIERHIKLYNKIAPPILNTRNDVYQLDVLNTDPEIYHDFFIASKSSKFHKKSPTENSPGL